MRRVLSVAALLLAVLAAFADDPAPAQATTAQLIEGLSADEASRRDACEQALATRWEDAHDEMQAALAKATDTEARARLERLLKSGAPTVWLPTIAEGLARAAKHGRPLLVVRGDGPRETPTTREGHLLRESLDSPEGEAALHGYVAVWIADKDVPGSSDPGTSGSGPLS